MCLIIRCLGVKQRILFTNITRFCWQFSFEEREKQCIYFHTLSHFGTRNLKCINLFWLKCIFTCYYFPFCLRFCRCHGDNPLYTHVFLWWAKYFFSVLFGLWPCLAINVRSKNHSEMIGITFCDYNRQSVRLANCIKLLPFVFKLFIWFWNSLLIGWQSKNGI